MNFDLAPIKMLIAGKAIKRRRLAIYRTTSKANVSIRSWRKKIRNQIESICFFALFVAPSFFYFSIFSWKKIIQIKRKKMRFELI